MKRLNWSMYDYGTHWLLNNDEFGFELPKKVNKKDVKKIVVFLNSLRG